MHRLLKFFLLAYAISWIVWFPLYAPSMGWGTFQLLPFHHALGAYGPMLAAFIMVYREGKRPVKDMLHSMINIKKLWVVAFSLFFPFALLVLCSLTDQLINGSKIDWHVLGRSEELENLGIIGFTAYNVVSFGYGEETGWRGYALPKLQRHFHPFCASVVLTVFWMGWHLPLFLYRTGYMGMSTGDMTRWALSLLTGSILLAWMYNKSKQSILVCALFHATIDVAFTSKQANQNVVQYLGITVTICGLAILLFSKGRLGYNLNGNEHLHCPAK